MKQYISKFWLFNSNPFWYIQFLYSNWAKNINIYDNKWTLEKKNNDIYNENHCINSSIPLIASIVNKVNSLIVNVLNN